jgi:hypothetical protein
MLDNSRDCPWFIFLWGECSIWAYAFFEYSYQIDLFDSPRIKIGAENLPDSWVYVHHYNVLAWKKQTWLVPHAEFYREEIPDLNEREWHV